MSAFTPYLRLLAMLLLLAAFTPLALSQDPSPIPIITSVSGCAGVSGPATFDCTLGISGVTLTLVGDGLDASSQQVYVGDSTRCVPDQGNSTVMTCRVDAYGWYAMSAAVALPISVLSLTSGVRSASTPDITATFVVYPPVLVASVSGCDDLGDAKTYNCNVSAAVLTVHGSGFQAGPTTQNWRFYFNAVNPGWQIQSGMYNWGVYSAQAVNDSVLTFSLQDVVQNNGNKMFSSGQLCITLQRNYIVTANSPFCLTFIATPANSAPGYAVNMSHPVITNVTGCAVNLAGATFGCQRSGNDLTITGTGFPTYGRLVTVGAYMCGEYAIPPTDTTKIVCYSQCTSAAHIPHAHLPLPCVHPLTCFPSVSACLPTFTHAPPAHSPPSSAAYLERRDHR